MRKDDLDYFLRILDIHRGGFLRKIGDLAKRGEDILFRNEHEKSFLFESSNTENVNSLELLKLCGVGYKDGINQ